MNNGCLRIDPNLPSSNCTADYLSDDKQIEDYVVYSSEPEVHLDLKIKIVPNPTPSEFQITNNRDVMSYAKVNIISATGEQMQSENNVISSRIYDPSVNGDGLYFVEDTT